MDMGEFWRSRDKAAIGEYPHTALVKDRRIIREVKDAIRDVPLLVDPARDKALEL